MGGREMIGRRTMCPVNVEILYERETIQLRKLQDTQFQHKDMLFNCSVLIHK
jgi:hypothetical protein